MWDRFEPYYLHVILLIMKLITRQRLHLKHHHIDKYDFLDKNVYILSDTTEECTLIKHFSLENPQEKNKGHWLSSLLAFEWFCAQKVVKQRKPNDLYQKQITTVVTLRKEKLFNLLDNCINSIFLSDILKVTKTFNVVFFSFDLSIQEYFSSTQINEHSSTFSSTQILSYFKKLNFFQQYYKVL
jgi:hypothetical protein